MQRAAEGNRLQIQVPADPQAAQPYASGVYWPLLVDEQLPQHRCSNRSFFRPCHHRRQLKWAFAEVQLFAGRSEPEHLNFARQAALLWIVRPRRPRHWSAIRGHGPSPHAVWTNGTLRPRPIATTARRRKEGNHRGQLMTAIRNG